MAAHVTLHVTLHASNLSVLTIMPGSAEAQPHHPVLTHLRQFHVNYWRLKFLHEGRPGKFWTGVLHLLSVLFLSSHASSNDTHYMEVC